MSSENPPTNEEQIDRIRFSLSDGNNRQSSITRNEIDWYSVAMIHSSTWTMPEWILLVCFRKQRRFLNFEEKLPTRRKNNSSTPNLTKWQHWRHIISIPFDSISYPCLIDSYHVSLSKNSTTVNRFSFVLSKKIRRTVMTSLGAPFTIWYSFRMNPDGTLEEPEFSSLTLGVGFIFAVIPAFMAKVIEYWFSVTPGPQIRSALYCCFFRVCVDRGEHFFHRKKKLPMVVSKFVAGNAQKSAVEKNHMGILVCTPTLCWGVSHRPRHPTFDYNRKL